MVAIGAETIRKIKIAQREVEPLIIDMIKESDEITCPMRTLMRGMADTEETKEVVTRVARMLYKHDLLTKMGLNLSNKDSFDTILYAFGYWGGQTLYRHGNRICACRKKCYL